MNAPRKQPLETLRDGEQMLKDVIEGSPVPQFVLDTNHRVLYWNKALEQLSGVRAEDVIGTTEQWRAFYAHKRPCLADLLLEDDWEGIERLYETWHHAPDALEGSCDVTGFYSDMGKHGKWLRFRAAVFRDSQKRVVGVIETLEDISEIKEAARQREAMIQELEAKNAELERFNYTVSHDLKSPLFTLHGFLGLLREDLAEGNLKSVQNDLARLENAARRMSRLLDELLELSRIGRLVRPFEKVSLEEIVQEAVALVSGRIANGDVKVEISAGLPCVHADRRHLVAVFQNLLDNAAKYMGEQARPRVEIGVRHDEGETVFFVRDNGIGIDPSYHEKIFSLFEQLDQKAEGTGIGLAMVRRIVEVHGGRVWVESEGPGHGATFCFTLPSGDGQEDSR